MRTFIRVEVGRGSHEVEIEESLLHPTPRNPPITKVLLEAFYMAKESAASNHLQDLLEQGKTELVMENRLTALEERKAEQRRKDQYLSDDPDGSGKRKSEREWMSILREESWILKELLRLKGKHADDL